MAGRKIPLSVRFCPQCGGKFSKHLPAMYCSKRCSKKAWGIANPAAIERYQFAGKFCVISPCIACGKIRNRRIPGFCSGCKPKKPKAQRKPHKPHRKRSVLCVVCRVTFWGCGRAKYCSRKCARGSIVGKQWKKKRRLLFGRGMSKRARALGVAYEPINRISVFRRDGWKCQICGTTTPQFLLVNNRHRRQPTIDHRVPISKGGGHTYENVQCCCRECNTRKGNSSQVGQLPMFSHEDTGGGA